MKNTILFTHNKYVNTHTTWISCAAFVLSGLNPAIAQTVPLIEEQVVTGTFTEISVKDSLQTVQIITAQDISRIQPPDLPSLLGRLSGVDFRDSGGRGSVSGVFVRGVASNAVVVLIDGVRSASATTGATALGSIPVEVIDRIEIITGPLSSFYGADAIGGVIQIFTKRGSEGFNVRGHERLGSFSSNEYGVSFEGGSKKHNVIVGLNREETDGFDRTDSDVDGNNDDDGFEETSISVSGFITILDNLELQLNFLNAENEVEFDNVFGTDTGFFSDNEIEHYSAKLNYRALNWLSLEATAGKFIDRGVTPAFDSNIRSERDQLNVIAHFNATELQTFSFGVDYYDDQVPDYEVEERDNLGVFGIYQINDEKVGMLLSLRNDDNETYGSNTSSGISISYNFSEQFKTVLSVGTAFLAPTFNELFFPGFSNPDLLPQESVSTELAFKWFDAQSQWRVSLYETNIENQIIIQNEQRTVENIDFAEITGIELEYNRQIGDFGIKTNADYSEARDAETDEFLPDRAVVSYNLILDHTFNRLINTLAVRGERRRHDIGQDFTIQELDAYVTLDWSLDYAINEHVALNTQIINLFDEDYVVNVAGNGFNFTTQERSFELGLAFKLK